MSGLSDEQLDDLYRRWLQKTSFTHLTTHVASLLAAARAEGAEKARAEVTERVEAVLSIWEGARPGSLLSTVFVTEKVRAALAGGERDE